eukprot:TRINITY_DN29911_c0_g1_i1.p2 TRINITY_DN29911_c0_g1~~TRINITY_DN29911_c0_g1_i1.p2  ORF type:complete len:115 (-),score=10.88 TRINITY_DN29911_c0_g1_i1:43-387(-)
MVPYKKTTAASLVFLTTCLGFASPVLAEEDALQVARDTARIAGGARFCKADEELVDEFIGKGEGKIAALAKDEYDKVSAAIEFKNLLTALSVKAPEGGCDEFLPKFEKAVKTDR